MSLYDSQLLNQRICDSIEVERYFMASVVFLTNRLTFYNPAHSLRTVGAHLSFVAISSPPCLRALTWNLYPVTLYEAEWSGFRGRLLIFGSRIVERKHRRRRVRRIVYVAFR
jgi:hypothetical protein